MKSVTQLQIMKVNLSYRPGSESSASTAWFIVTVAIPIEFKHFISLVFTSLVLSYFLIFQMSPTVHCLRAAARFGQQLQVGTLLLLWWFRLWVNRAGKCNSLRARLFWHNGYQWLDPMKWWAPNARSDLTLSLMFITNDPASFCFHVSCWQLSESTLCLVSCS